MTDEKRLTNYLVDIYSIEQQALEQLRTAPELAGSPRLSAHLDEHLAETERQAELVRRLLEERGESPSRLKDAVMRLGGKGFLLFARSQPDTTGKLCAHAFSYEALELAGYELLAHAARDAGDADAERVAVLIRDQEAAMRDRLESDFDEAVAQSLVETGESAEEALPAYLADAHAIEMQAISLLKRADDMAGAEPIEQRYSVHRRESEAHARTVERRLSDIGSDTSSLKDAALSLGAINWAFFFRALNDTPAKLCAFVHAFEHLEIAGYELLKRVARQAGDRETVALCDQILADERKMAEDVFDLLGSAVAAVSET